MYIKKENIQKTESREQIYRVGFPWPLTFFFFKRKIFGPVIAVAVCDHFEIFTKRAPLPGSVFIHHPFSSRREREQRLEQHLVPVTAQKAANIYH